MSKLVTVSLVLSSVLLLGAAGCSTTDAAKPAGAGGTAGGFKTFCDLPVPCQQIAQACMPKDTGKAGPLHDCHLIGHEDGTLAACAPALASCLKTCTDAPALSDGPVEDLGASCRDAGTADGGP